MKRKTFLCVSVAMLVFAIGFVAYALNNPQGHSHGAMASRTQFTPFIPLAWHYALHFRYAESTT